MTSNFEVAQVGFQSTRRCQDFAGKLSKPCGSRAQNSSAISEGKTRPWCRSYGINTLFEIKNSENLGMCRCYDGYLTGNYHTARGCGTKVIRQSASYITPGYNTGRRLSSWMTHRAFNYRATHSYWAALELRMSESPASRIAMVEQRKSLPQAVPSSICYR